MGQETTGNTIYKFARDAVLTILGGIVIEPTLKRLHFDVSPYLRQIWFCIAAFLTIDVLWRSRKLRAWSVRRYGSLSGGWKMMSYVIVALIGAGTFAVYWYAVTHIIDNPLGAKAEQRESDSNANRTEKQPTADEIAEAVAKKLPSFPEKHGVTDSATAVVSHTPPKSAEPSMRRPVGPRLGIGPEGYKDISDEQLGQWAIEETDKITQLAESAIADTGISVNATIWRFTNDFNDCCAQDVKELRTELLRRLGPPAKDLEEIQAWTALFPELKYPEIRDRIPERISPTSVKYYAPYLRRLGLRLKRRAVARSAPIAMHFTEQRISPEKPEFPYRILVTVETNRQLSAGYVVVQFAGRLAGVGCDFEDSKLVFGGNPIENRDLAKLLSTAFSGTNYAYALQIGRTPFTPSKPIHVVAFGKEPFHISAVTFFDE